MKLSLFFSFTGRSHDFFLVGARPTRAQSIMLTVIILFSVFFLRFLWSLEPDILQSTNKLYASYTVIIGLRFSRI